MSFVFARIWLPVSFKVRRPLFTAQPFSKCPRPLIYRADEPFR